MDPEIILNALQMNHTEDLLEEAQRNADKRQADGPAIRRLEELRAISNVAQALENLIAQCGSAPAFAGLRAMAEGENLRARRELDRRIHGALSDGRP